VSATALPGPSDVHHRSTLRPSADRIQAIGIRVVTLGLFVWALLVVDNFASRNNFSSILFSMSAIGTAAVGMAVVTLSGNLFMLSMGPTAAVASILFAETLQHGLFLAVLLCALLGLVTGAAQGFIIGVLGANPIVTTIAAASVITGLGAVHSGGLTAIGEGDSSWLGVDRRFDLIPNQVVVPIAATMVLTVLVQRARIGRELRLIGTRRSVAEHVALRIGRALLVTYAGAGVCAGLAGALLASQSAQGNLQVGATLDFDAIAAVLVGGVAIYGGRGKVTDALAGALFLAVLSNVLLVNGLAFEVQLVARGAVVLVAVSAGAVLHRWSSR
jgi:ribose transport system permease protein